MVLSSLKAANQEVKDLGFPGAGFLCVTMDVLVHGRPLRTVFFENKTYLPVPQTGEEYQIRVWHHGPRRVTAVVSVDGLSVITGQPASENDPGYIIAPTAAFSSKAGGNLGSVAAFRFVDRDKSYASLMGKAENIGVIGLIAFEERIIVPFPELAKRDLAAKAEGFRAVVGSIGTEYGDVDSEAALCALHSRRLQANHHSVLRCREGAAGRGSAGRPAVSHSLSGEN